MRETKGEREVRPYEGVKTAAGDASFRLNADMERPSWLRVGDGLRRSDAAERAGEPARDGGSVSVEWSDRVGGPPSEARFDEVMLRPSSRPWPTGATYAGDMPRPRDAPVDSIAASSSRSDTDRDELSDCVLALRHRYPNALPGSLRMAPNSPPGTSMGRSTSSRSLARVRRAYGEKLVGLLACARVARGGGESGSVEADEDVDSPTSRRELRVGPALLTR